jgi:hypothetical protein
MFQRPFACVVVLVTAAVGMTLLTDPACAGQIGAGEKAPVINKKKNKNDELPTQARGELPQPPLALAADAARLSFLVAPLSGRGLLSQQTKEALKFLILQARGAQFIRVRAFVAGTGDLRRVPQLVSEVFAEKHLSVPVVTTVEAGLLPLENAQVLIEATLQQSRLANPEGVRFVTAEGATAAAAVAQLKQSGELLRATCYVPALEGCRFLRPATEVEQPGRHDLRGRDAGGGRRRSARRTGFHERTDGLRVRASGRAAGF